MPKATLFARNGGNGFVLRCLRIWGRDLHFNERTGRRGDKALIEGHPVTWGWLTLHLLDEEKKCG